MSEQVRDVMMPVLCVVPAGCALPRAAHLMRSWDVRDVLVVDDDGALCGLLRDTDIIVMAIASGIAPSELSAADCCEVAVPRVDADQRIVEALGTLRYHQVRRVPVVEGSQLVGTVWLGDLEAAAARISATHHSTHPRVDSTQRAPRDRRRQVRPRPYVSVAPRRTPVRDRAAIGRGSSKQRAG